MNEDRNRDRLGELLRDLPRTPASTGFTMRTMARIAAAEDGTVASSRPWSRYAFVGATVAVMALVLGAGAWRMDRERDAARARAELELLRAEQQALLEEMRNFGEMSSPEVLVGGDDSVEFVYDLNRPYRPGGTQPVSLRLQTTH